MNVPAAPAIRLSADPVTRAGWRCPGCGTHYSPDLTFCHCSAVPAVPAVPPPSFPFQPPPSYPVLCTCYQSWSATIPPPPCPAHGMTTMIRVTC